MFQAFIQQKGITFFIFFLLVLSIALQIMIGVLYQNMIKETENMSVTRNKLLKQFKLKFVNCYKMNMGVANIPIFVDKFMGKMSFGRFRVSMLSHLSGQLMLLSVFFSGVAVCRAIIRGSGFGMLLPFYIVSFFGLYIYFSVSSMVDIKGKTRLLKINLVDYLENHMVNRLSMPEVEEQERVEREEWQVEERRDKSIKENRTSRMDKNTVEGAPSKSMFSRSEQQELEELLKELMA